MLNQKAIFASELLFGILIIQFLACHPMAGKPIRPDSLIMPAGSRVLICEAKTELTGYEIKAFRGVIDLPGIIWMDPPKEGMKGLTMNQVVKAMVDEKPVRTVLVIRPITNVERQYNPYLAFKGWRKKTYKEGRSDGRFVYRTTEEPVRETKYRYRCVKITYRVFQFDKDGEFMGSVHISGDPVHQCPENTSEDIEIDVFDRLISWLQSHISTQ